MNLSQALLRAFSNSCIINTTSVGHCTVNPTGPNQVSQFLRTIRPLVLDGNATFAIRNGGDQQPPDDEQFGSGVIILDLSDLRGVNVHSDGTVSIAAGEQWGSVYEQLGNQGLAAAGGRNGGRGIGTLALQGGLSFFSSSGGFVADNVVEYGLAIPSGDTIYANSTEHADLWKSLKGGSNNFGIVTSYRMKTFPQGPVWGGYVYYLPSSFPGQLEAMVDLLLSPHPSGDTHLILSTVYVQQMGQVISVNRVYQTGGAEEPTELQPFTTVGPQIGNLTSLGYVSVAKASADPTTGPQRSRRAHIDTTLKANKEALQAATDIFLDSLDPIKALNDSTLTASIIFEPLAVSLLEASDAQGGNLFGLQANHGPLVSVSFVLSWGSELNDDAILSHFRQVMEQVNRDAAEKGQHVPFELMSTAFHLQDPISSYGRENKQFMQAVSKRYDPEGLFEKGLVGGFKLFL